MVIVNSVTKQVPPSCLSTPVEPIVAHMVSLMKRVREFFRRVLNNPLEHSCAT